MNKSKIGQTLLERLVDIAPPLQYLYLSAMIPSSVKTLDEAFSVSPDLKKVYATQPQAKRILDEVNAVIAS